LQKVSNYIIVLQLSAAADNKLRERVSLASERFFGTVRYDSARSCYVLHLPGAPTQELTEQINAELPYVTAASENGVIYIETNYGFDGLMPQIYSIDPRIKYIRLA
jgi:hypothetical protein